MTGSGGQSATSVTSMPSASSVGPCAAATTLPITVRGDAGICAQGCLPQGADTIVLAGTQNPAAGTIIARHGLELSAPGSTALIDCCRARPRSYACHSWPMRRRTGRAP